MMWNKERLEKKQSVSYTLSGVPVLGVVSSIGGRHRHTGKPWHNLGGLAWYDNRARWYDPVTMRFLAPDPLTDQFPDISPWAYCHDNPVNRIDPTGQRDYFNNKGQFVRHVDDGNEHAYMLMTSSDKPKNVDRAIERNEFILVPNIDAMQKMDLMFEHSDNGMAHEEGFIVFPTGNSTKIQGGNDGESYMAYSGEKEYSVHIHQLNGPDGEYGLAKPSNWDQDKSDEFGKYEIVLGYKAILQKKKNTSMAMAGVATTSLGQDAFEIIYEKLLAIYKGSHAIIYQYEDFKKIVNEITFYINSSH